MSHSCDSKVVFARKALVRNPSAQPALPDALRPRYSLRASVVLGVTLLLTVSTALAGWLSSRLTLDALRNDLITDTDTLAQSTAHLLEPTLRDNDEARLNKIIKPLLADRRVAFLIVHDETGRTVADHYNDPVAWNEYTRLVTPRDRNSPLTLNRSVTLERADTSPLIVRRQLVRDRSAMENPGVAPHTLGSIEIALTDPQQARLWADMQDAAITVTAILNLIAIPLIVLWVSRWTRPLRSIVDAMHRLARGEPAVCSGANRQDEIGVLARSFQQMSHELAAAQDALLQANQALEQKVTQRTRELELANQKLQDQMTEKDQFIRAISHDLGAPLRNIEGITQLLMLKHRQEMAEDVLTKLQRIVANVKAENELINDLLELSRLRTRHGKRIILDFDQEVRQLAQVLSFDLDTRRIALSIDNPLPRVKAERNRFRQVFQNLIENAIKYMPDESAVREVHVGWRMEHGTPLFYVRDTGHGVAPEDHKTIFQLFRRAQHTPRNRDVKGRGVGLATAAAIVEGYGGRMWVQSTPPHGATFYFTLDAQYLAGSAAAPLADPETAEASAA